MQMDMRLKMRTHNGCICGNDARGDAVIDNQHMPNWMRKACLSQSHCTFGTWKGLAKFVTISRDT